MSRSMRCAFFELKKDAAAGADGGTRPLGVAAIEEKKVVTEIILMPIYEAEFLGFSYGFPWLNAGVMKDGEWRDDLRRTSQGSVISTSLANVYLHDVLGLWFHRKWRSREANGGSVIVGYAEDFVVGFQHRRDAERFLDAVKERFGLELHPDKTRLIECGCFAKENRLHRGQGKPERFDFPGFTQYCAKPRGGHFQLGRKPVAKRRRAH